MARISFHQIKHRLLYIPIAVLFMLSFVDCAKKGRPTGGPKDSIPPVILKSVPENYTTRFSEKEIRITFDEYIKLKDIQKNLIISPPLKYTPVITPLSTSKTLKIKILDTLKENTTYSINFGQSIVDNNEGNAFDYYKYVFSTGTYIDSLKLSGKVRDIKLLKSDDLATIMLYEVNDTFKDSLIFSEKPTYITTTRDSTKTFELSNIKEGTYLLMALQEKNSDYTFQPSTDKIAFESNFVTLPTDSTFDLTLFKENVAFALAKPKQESKNRIAFGYTGKIDSLQIALLSEVPDTFEKRIFKDVEKDTLYYWYKPALEVDSLLFETKAWLSSTIDEKSADTVSVRMRDLFADSLVIGARKVGFIKPKDTFQLVANIPLESLNAEKIRIMDKDTLAVDFTSSLNKKNNTVSISFPTSEEQFYRVTLLPEAFSTFLGKTNDTLTYNLKTKLESDYGQISLTLQNVSSYPLIAELVDANFKPIASTYLKEPGLVEFSNIDPAFYYIRVIEDLNKNGVWDAGSFLDRRQPETITYYPSKIEVRPNWSLKETFILK